MISRTIQLGPVDRLEVLYSFPNTNRDTSNLAQTIEHWMNLTLKHDGLRRELSSSPAGYEGAQCAVRVDGNMYSLLLSGPPEGATEFETYAVRLPRFLEHGWNAWTQDVSRIKQGASAKPWDPNGDGWRFFLSHGVTLARPKTLQFFHYPPIRLLALRNYLEDPVPQRCEELLVANGVKDYDEARRYECVMDAVPIGASDEEGQRGTIPIDEFHAYQAAQTRLLLDDPGGATKSSVTIPIVVYGQHPKRVFSELFLNESSEICGWKGETDETTREWLEYRDGRLRDDTTVLAAEIIPGKVTPVVGSRHPYAFYGMAQAGPKSVNGTNQAGKVGQGYIHPRYVNAEAEVLYNRMVKDLVIARWQKMLADRPSYEPGDALREATEYWKKPERRHEVNTLVLHQGSLWYPCRDQGKEPTLEDPQTLSFQWKLSRDDADALASEHRDDLAACVNALYRKATGD
jgi:hypothetical protein